MTEKECIKKIRALDLRIKRLQVEREKLVTETLVEIRTRKFLQEIENEKIN